MEVRAGVRVMKCCHGGKTRLQLLAHFRLARQTRERQVLGIWTADHVDEPCIATAHHGVDAKQIVGRAVRRITGELPERTFFGVLGRIDRAFEHELRSSRYTDAVTRRAHEFKRRVEQATGYRTLIRPERYPCGSGQHEQWMSTNHHRDAEHVAALLCALQHPPEVAA